MKSASVGGGKGGWRQLSRFVCRMGGRLGAAEADDGRWWCCQLGVRARKHTHRHTHTNSQTHTRARARAHTHTHTHTHARTQEIDRLRMHQGGGSLGTVGGGKVAPNKAVDALIREQGNKDVVSATAHVLCVCV